jgi:HSP20 family protein
VDADAVTAEFDKGVLEVRIPKPEERKPRRVQIKAHSNGNGSRPTQLEGTATDRAA